MRNHATDEGAQLTDGLGHAGYILCGHNIPTKGWRRGDGPLETVNVRQILALLEPGVMFLQDAREHMGLTAGKGHDQRERFVNVEALGERPDVFTLTVVKDAHRDHELHQRTAREIGCRGWVTPYHPDVVTHLAPFVRKEHLVRVYHSVEPADVPPYTPAGRRGCLLSGAMNRTVYPLRARLRDALHQLPEAEWLPHPGYGRVGCKTPEYLKTLSRFKVAVCTSSIYGYALRKIVEGVAAGCVVVTDLPVDDVLPGIDGALVRVHPSITANSVGRLLRRLYDEYDPARQEHFARLACRYYDWRAAGLRLARDIEAMRGEYR